MGVWDCGGVILLPLHHRSSGILKENPESVREC